MTRQQLRFDRTTYLVMAFLRLGDLTRRGDAWRFGVRRIGDATVAKLVAGGCATVAGDRVVATRPAEGARA